MPTRRTQPLASTEYGNGLQYGYDIYPWWNNLNDKVAYERMFATGDGQNMRVAQAMISQDPLTSRAEIRDNMNRGYIPPKTGYNTDELTVSEVLEGDFDLEQNRIDTAAWNDFSGTNSETNATQRPYGGTW